MQTSKLHLLPPMKVAEELLLIDSSALRKIFPEELVDEAWIGKRKVRIIIIRQSLPVQDYIYIRA